MADARTTDAYAHPSIYDILHTPGTAFEVDLIEGLATKWNAPGGKNARWLEPACGTGRYLRVLGGRGRRCTGFDLDEGMLAYARESIRNRGLTRKVRLLSADMASFANTVGSRSHAVAFITVNTLRHLLDAKSMQRHFEDMARVLVPGGLYIVGISLSRYDEEEPSEDVWTAQRGVTKVRQIMQYLPPDKKRRLESVFSHLQVDKPSGREFYDSAYELRSYDEKQWATLIAKCGFERLGAIDDLGNEVADTVVNYQLEVLRKT